MRIAVVSDVHSNLVALDAVIASLGSVDAVWHLGDIVGYGPEPDGVVGRLEEIGAIGVRGNHDAAAVGGTEIEYFNTDARQAMEWTRGAIAPATRRWLDGLPPVIVERPFTLVHGSLRDPIWEYVMSLNVARANLARLSTPYGLHGHTHVPVVFREDNGSVDAVVGVDGSFVTLDERRVLLNPGSVGQPRDGDRRASYLVIDTDKSIATWHRVEYDIAATQAAMRRIRLPPRLVARLEHGF